MIKNIMSETATPNRRRTTRVTDVWHGNWRDCISTQQGSCRVTVIQEDKSHRWNTAHITYRGAGPLVIGGHNLSPPLFRTGLTKIPNFGWARVPPPPVPLPFRRPCIAEWRVFLRACLLTRLLVFIQLFNDTMLYKYTDKTISAYP